MSGNLLLAEVERLRAENTKLKALLEASAATPTAQQPQATTTPSIPRTRLSNPEISRFSRQLLMPEIGVQGTTFTVWKRLWVGQFTFLFPMNFPAGQLNLLNSSVLVVGAGGLGAPAIMYLAAAGIGASAISTKASSCHFSFLMLTELNPRKVGNRRLRCC